jgi:hypothetical protein
MTEKVKLPDFDDMLGVAEEIGLLKTRIALNKANLEKLEALITQSASTDPQYFINDKPPSMTYIKSHYHVLGLNDATKSKLDELRSQISEDEGKLKESELLFEVYRSMIDVWRTQSANQRGAYYEG